MMTDHPAKPGADVDLHALANAPGFGKARKELARAGLWDDDEGKPEGMYTVAVSATLTYEGTVVVDARSRTEARKIARSMVEDDINLLEETFDITVHSADVVDGPEDEE